MKKNAYINESLYQIVLPFWGGKSAKELMNNDIARYIDKVEYNPEYSINVLQANIFFAVSSKAADVFKKLNIDEISNVNLRRTLETFIRIFISELSQYDTKYNVCPEMNVEVEDDNVFLNWMFNPKFRIGFNIVEGMKESSWFVFKESNNIMGSISGELSWENARDIIRWVLIIAMENS